MATHPFGPIERQLFVGYRPLREANGMTRVRLSTKIIEKCVFKFRQHPILLQEGGAPTTAQLNAEGYGVRFTVKGKTDLQAGIIPTVTYAIMHQGSTVAKLKLKRFLSKGIKRLADENFGGGLRFRLLRNSDDSESDSEPEGPDISLIAAKILTPCIGCEKLLIDSTPERIRIVRDGIEELNAPQESLMSTEEQVKILKKYDFFLNQTTGCITDDIHQDVMLTIAQKVYRANLPAAGVGFIIRRIIAIINGLVSTEAVAEPADEIAESSDESSQAGRSLSESYDIQSHLKQIKTELHRLLEEKATSIPNYEMRVVAGAYDFSWSDDQRIQFASADASSLDQLVAASVLQTRKFIEKVEKPDAIRNIEQRAFHAHEVPRFGFEIHNTKAKILEFWRTGEYEIRRYRMKLFAGCTGKYTAIRENSLLYMDTGKRIEGEDHQAITIKKIPLMLNLELLTTVLTPYTPSAATDALIAAGEAETPNQYGHTTGLNTPEAQRVPFGEFKRLIGGCEDYSSSKYKCFTSPYGGVWWYGYDCLLSFWHPDDIFPKVKQDPTYWVGSVGFDILSKSRDTMKMHFCPKGSLVFFGAFTAQQPAIGLAMVLAYKLYCLKIINSSKIDCLTETEVEDVVIPFLDEDWGEELRYNVNISWISKKGQIFSVVSLHCGRIDIYLFQNRKFVPMLKKRMKFFSRKYAMVGELRAKTRRPVRKENTHTHYTVRLSLKF